MPFNTRNPIPSGDLRDLDDNARNIDTWANDKTKLSHPDRFGVERYTWHGIEQKAQLDLSDAVADATAEAGQYRDQALDAKNAAQEAAMMSGFSKYADTLAQLEGGIGTDYIEGDVVMIFQDESRGGTSSIYKVESGVAEFKLTFDKTRQDLLSFTGNISADAEWSDVPAHSDPAFDVQAQALANRTLVLDGRVSRSVVDFGADRTGVRDSAAAFEAAKAAGVNDVPEGEYFVSRYVEGEFTTAASVRINGSTTNVKRAKEDARHKKEILFAGGLSLPFYSFVESKWGASAVPSTQGLFVDDAGYFYVIFEIGSKSINTDDKKFLIARFDNKFAYAGCAAFESDKYVEQAFIESGFLYFAGASTEIYKYAVSSPATWSNGDFSISSGEKLVQTAPGFDNDFQLTKNAGRWYNSSRGNINGWVDGAVARHFIFEFNESLALSGYVQLDFVDAGWNGSTANVNTPLRNANPKRQSFVVTDEEIICHMGGYWSPSSSQYDGFRQQGLKVFSRNGSHKDSILYDPEKFISVLSGAGLSCYFVEAEGVFVKHGQVFTIYATGTKSTGGTQFVILREFSGSAKALDFSAASSSPRGMSKRNSDLLIVMNDLPVNPITGARMPGLVEVCKYLADSAELRAVFAVPNGSSFDRSALGLMAGFYQYTVENRRGGGFLITAKGPTRNGDCTAWATLNSDGTAFATVFHQPVRAASLRLYGSSVDSSNQRISYVKDTVEVLAQAINSTSSIDRLEYGGNSSAFDCATSHRFYASTDGSKGQKTGVGIFDIDYSGAFPSRDNAIPSGKPANRWTVIHAGTATISTSDEREKEQWRELSIAEKSAAIEIKQAIRAFKFSDAVSMKGESARLHFGVGAQTVGDILRRHGLNPEDYAFWCYDEWKDDQGLLLGRFGIRYEELIMFILASS